MILSIKSEELVITHSKFMNYSRFVSNRRIFLMKICWLMSTQYASLTILVFGFGLC